MTYEFICKECKITLEVCVAAKDMPAYKRCPKCGARMGKVISGGLGTVFKGDGWPGKDNLRKRENKGIQRKVRKAKKLKSTGKVPHDAILKLEDKVLGE